MFCEKRKEKREICRRLKITHFVDDSEDVIKPLEGLVPNLFLFGGSSIAGQFVTVESWSEIVNLLVID